MQELSKCEMPVKEKSIRMNIMILFSSNYCGGCNADFYVHCKKVDCG